MNTIYIHIYKAPAEQISAGNKKQRTTQVHRRRFSRCGLRLRRRQAPPTHSTFTPHPRTQSSVMCHPRTHILGCFGGEGEGQSLYVRECDFSCDRVWARVWSGWLRFGMSLVPIRVKSHIYIYILYICIYYIAFRRPRVFMLQIGPCKVLCTPKKYRLLPNVV